MDKQQHLVLFDADRIKEYVFATGRLKEIRGASQLVRCGTDSETLQRQLKLRPEQIIFAEGGSGLLEAESKEAAADLCRRLAANYREITKGATLTAVATPYNETDFAAAIQHAARQLQLAKEMHQECWQSSHTPFTELCASCGAYPAISLYPVTTATTERLCRRCHAKRHCSDSLRTRSQNPGDDIFLDETAWGGQFLAELSSEEFPRWENARLPENLSKLAELAHPNNYLAFLYADGNGLGQLVQQQKSKAGYQALSRRISTALRQALWYALKTHFPRPRGHEQQQVPFEVIALGGDDLILVTVADQALSLAVTLGRLFEQFSRSAPTADDGLTLSLGVVIAHPGQPILNLEQQARKLLRSAKREYPGQAAIDFHIVSTPILNDLDQIRAAAYTMRPNAGTQIHLTRRPFTLCEMEQLLDHVWACKEGGEQEAIPRNKLHTLYQALFAGEEAAEQEAFFLRSRLNPAQQRKVDAFFAAFGIQMHTKAVNAPRLPWGRKNGDLFTPFGDLVEIYEFIHAAPVKAPAYASPPTRSPVGEQAQEEVSNGLEG